jgi:hypothetical protein
MYLSFPQGERNYCSLRGDIVKLLTNKRLNYKGFSWC